MRDYHYFAFLGLVFLIVAAILGGGCSGKSSTGPDGIIPMDPFPANSAVDVPVLTAINWSYADYDPDSVTFDLYFGTVDPPPLMAEAITDTSYDPGPLGIDKIYYWKVVAHPDSTWTVTSPLWSFSTAHTFIFPLAQGNRWDYTRRAYFMGVSSDSLMYLFDEIMVGTGTTQILGKKILFDTLQTFMFHSPWMEGEYGGYTDMYRTGSADGLYEHAYWYQGGDWIPIPKKALPAGYHLEFKGLQFENPEELIAAFCNPTGLPASKGAENIIYEPHPVRELAYPLEVGQRWAYRRLDLGDGWDMDKEVVGLDTLHLPAGTFECFTIKWFWDIDDDGEWDNDISAYDAVSAIGTVKRRVFIFGIIVTNETDQPIGTADYTYNYELTGYELK